MAPVVVVSRLQRCGTRYHDFHMRLESGSRLGPYEISGPIGAGGMGEVYRARDTRLGRDVAIKVLPREVSADRGSLARFEREARSSSALNHRNIVTVHDFTSQEGEAWLVMELVRGESLRDVIARGPLPLKKILPIAAGIADGLAAAHAAGLVHRDLKPENVMIANDGTPKILDFGLVKDTAPAHDETTQQRTNTGVVVGTASYMSPEQARGEAVDFRTDQFSFGVVLDEMIAGRNPFRRATPAETLAAILHDDPQPPGEPLGWIVERCLQKNPDDRYGSTADLAHDLRRAGTAPRAVQGEAATGVRTAWIAAAAAVVLIAAAIVAWKWPRVKPAPPLEAAIATPAIEEVAFGEVTPAIAISPDGRFVVVNGAGSDEIARLWLHDLRSGTLRPIDGTENAFAFTFSPDSRSIAYGAGGKLQIASVDGGPPRSLADVSPPGEFQWAGNTILFSEPTGIFRIDSRGGTPVRIVPTEPSRPADVPMWAQMLPGGKQILYLATIRGGEEIGHALMSASIDGSSVKRIASIDSRAIYTNGWLLYARDGTLLAQRFDPRTLTLAGDARPVVPDMFYFRSTGLAAFSVSNDGLLVWRTAPRPSRQLWVDRVGAEAATVGTAVFGPGRLSPDGSRYAAAIVDPKQGTSDIWIYDLARQTSARLTFHLTEESNPVWSPEGATLYYRGDVLGPPDIFRWNLGQDRGVLLYRGPGIEQPEDVSPDGKSLLLVSYNRTIGERVFVLSLQHPTEVRPFAAGPYNNRSPRFSPDGNWVAFESDASGRPEIYTLPFGGAALPLRVSTDGGRKPRWRRDGKELFFLAPHGRMMSVAMNGGTPVAAPRMLFRSDAVDFEPAGDGLHFLIRVEDRPLDPPVHLLSRWMARVDAD